MYVKNLLNAGDLVSVVPTGLPVILQYDEEGRLHRITEGYEDTGKDISVDILPAIREHLLVPLHITVKQGTTLITGVFCISENIKCVGDIPDACYSLIKQCIKDNSNDIQFYAGNIFSYATMFRGGHPARQWLKMAGFELLPATLVSAATSEATFNLQTVQNSKYLFSVPSHYWIFRGNQFKCPSLELKSTIVTNIEMYQSIGGFFRGKITCGEKIFDTSWVDVVKFNIQPNSLLIYNRFDTIVRVVHSYVEMTNDQQIKLTDVYGSQPTMITCPICHKVVPVPTFGQFVCDDPQCVSHRYPEVIHFLEVLDLPTISYDRYKEIVRTTKSLFSVLDLFSYPEYQDTKVSTTFSKLIEAFVPANLSITEDTIRRLCNECNNSVTTLEYYLVHPELISKQLHIQESDIVDFVMWASEPANTVDLISSFHFSNITIVVSERKFNGLPILRNDSICLTGRFSHGTNTEIAMILRSYSADVTVAISDKTTCVVVGDLNEEVDARIIQQARQLGIPVIREQEFFDKFDIDSDLKQDL